MFNRTIYLGQNVSATSAAFVWAGGRGTFTATGTFGGGTVKLQFQDPAPGGDGSWVDVGTYTTLTAAGGGEFVLPPCNMRVNIATATAVYAKVMQVQPA